MTRILTVALVLVSLAALAVAQDAPQRGKIKKVNADEGVLTVAGPDGKDHDLVVMDSTRFMGADGNPIKDGLKNKEFKEGAAVMFKTVVCNEKMLLIGVRLIGGDAPKADTSRLKPLTEMANEKYHGFAGGLYPGGKNERPANHEKAGLAIAKQVRPLDGDGKPSQDGKIVLLSIGMSNTTQVFSTFQKLAARDADISAQVVLVDGAQGGMTAARIQNPDDPKGGAQFWKTVDGRLAQAGVSSAQVQVVWIKEADAGPTEGFPKYAQTLQAELAKIVQLLPKRFPNIKLAYLSSRTYGGYAKTKLNPEPYAFESGFAVKWLIEQQIQGDDRVNHDAARGAVAAPWLGWGPYLWANRTTKRADGFFYEESDFGNDGTHPSPAGREKAARELLRFFKTDTTTKGWFTR